MAKPHEIRKKTPAAAAGLRDSEESFRLLVESVRDYSIIMLDPMGIVKSWNPGAQRIKGYRAAEIIGQHFSVFFPEEARLRNWPQQGLAIAREAGRYEEEGERIRKDGSAFWAHVIITPVFDEKAELRGYAKVTRDLTARKQEEDAQRETEERFRAVVNSANEGILVYDRQLIITAGNLAAERIIGLPLAGMIGKPGFTSLLRCVREDGTPLPPEERPTRVTIRAGQSLQGQVVGITRADGSITWLSVNTAFLRRAGELDFYGIVATISDITEQRGAQDALRESERRFRQTFELAASGIAHIGLDRKFIRVNRRLCEILGYAEQELIGLTGREFSHPADLDVINSQRPKVYAGEVDRVRVEKRYLRKDGSTVWVAFSMVVERDTDGKPLYEIAIFDDITERKSAESALRESEERFRSLTQLSSDWYWEQDENFRFTGMSQSIAARSGLEATDHIGKTRWDLPAPNLGEAQWAAHRAQLEARQPFRDFEICREDAAGKLRYVLVSGEPIFDADGIFKGYRGVGQDITERRRAEAELRRTHEELGRKAQELERSNAELGQFAYVASHDLQEPLRMVSSYTQLLLRRYGERLDGDAKEFMAFIVDGATRMKQLIEDLLTYSRVGTRSREFHPIAIESALRRALMNLKSSIDESSASVSYDALPTLEADELQLTQLFQNLIGNALKFRSASVPRIHVEVTQLENAFQFAVRDNGIGIDAQYFERIFMVFQRLHNKGECPGTGIGLAICKKVVERHGGRIWVESRPDEGASFFFTLPRKQGEK